MGLGCIQMGIIEGLDHVCPLFQHIGKTMHFVIFDDDGGHRRPKST